ncbi:MAG: aminotransferase class IV [Brevundimonas sp.]|uniref:aminotransferase class IV n=1 Tax=Brevundimonas sp. TaxID=1871086 RepID=UPI0027343F58|nr:aminotransferase class IV [Brevundimonas sp.]MDP3406362.1 aminotransferase class IV [Brevundimonas sp.]
MLIDGQAPTGGDHHHLALVNYGAYTAFRIEGGGVRGLDRHLARLEASAVELFGEPVGEDRLRGFLRTAMADREEAWLRVSLFSPEIWPRTPSARVQPRVLTVVSPPPPPLATEVRLQVRTYARELPHIKHTATFGLIHARRQAREAGLDDALFADAAGRISEGPSWNIGFLAGDTVVWPQAPMLAGVAQSLIQDHLAGVGLSGVTEPVFLSDLDRFDGAFFCNSATPACAVTAIDARRFTPDDRLGQIAAAWSAAPVQGI